MSPNDADRDTKCTARKDKDDNPFVKFKRFADAQIGSVLQGIIGLPSVFSKHPGDDGSQWTDLKDDLKRRDGKLAEQLEAKASELPHHDVNSVDDKGKIRFEKPDGSLPRSLQADIPSNSTPGDEDIEKESIELFSPIKSSVFQQWYFSKKHNTLNAQEMIRSKVLDDCIRSPVFLANRHPLNSVSVLPYILFSPYSPLALSSMPPPRPGPHISESPKDDFPYCQAFEDLLLTNQGRPMSAYDRHIKDSPIATTSPGREFMRAKAGLEWIDRLAKYGLLTEEPWAGYFATRLLKGPVYMTYAQPEANARNQDNATEQDVYAFLERIGGSLASPVPLRDAKQAMEAFINDVVKCLPEQENNTESHGPNHSRQASPRIADANSDQNESGIVRRLVSTFSKSAFTQIETCPSQTADVNATRSVESDQVEDFRDESTALPATDRVVATTTTTQHHIDKDGSVNTTVMIQKLFADGSTSVTTTAKARYPPDDANLARDEWEDLPDEGSYRQTDIKHGTSGDLRQDEKEKGRGWFWK